MSVKTMLLFLGQLLIIQAVFSQCIRREPSCGFGPNGINGFESFRNAGPYAYSNSPAYPVPNQPIGISVSADNLVIDGYLDVAGNLPLLGSVVIDSSVPSDGQVKAYYGCGDGNVGITSVGSPAVQAQPLQGPGINPYNMVPNFGGFDLAALNMKRPGGCGFV